MGFDASKLEAIERIMDQLATELGRPATTAQVRERAQTEGVTNSTGTVHRYMAELAKRRPSQGAVEPQSLAIEALGSPGELKPYIAQLNGAVDAFTQNVSATLDTTIAAERQHFARILAQQHGTSRRELEAAARTIAELEQTLNAVIAESEESSVEHADALVHANEARAEALAEAKATGVELEKLRADLADKISAVHALEIKVTRLEAEEQRHREATLDLKIAKTAMANEIAELKKERSELRAKLDDVDPLRLALTEWQDYVGRSREARDVSIMISKAALEKK